MMLRCAVNIILLLESLLCYCITKERGRTHILLIFFSLVLRHVRNKGDSVYVNEFSL